MKVPSFISSPEVRVVEASAGSGKTYSLAKRYVQLLLHPKLSSSALPLRNILAITFTNKASYEMKKRILSFLKNIALETLSPVDEKEILTPLGLTVKEARPQALRVMDELIHNYNFFQVQTIDSFINALLSGCAFKIGLSAQFRIRRDFLDYLEESLDHMIREASEDKEAYEILTRFLHQYLFLENKTGWFPKKDMLLLLKALYEQSNIYGRMFALTVLPGEQIAVRKKKLIGLLKKLHETLPIETHKRFYDGLTEFLLRYENGFDFDAVSDYFANENVPVKKGADVPASLESLWDKVREELRSLSEAEAYSLFNAYVDVFNRINAAFHRKALKDDILFLPELNRQARKLFDDGAVTVEELYYRLATRFHHYLIDEFQDTSRLQWQNLELMVEEALSTGGTFFYVGDKKQAIYSFRGGEARQFDEVKERFKAFNIQTEFLNTNYRSQKAIVEFNNKVFSPENLKRLALGMNEDKDSPVKLSLNDLDMLTLAFQASQQEFLPKKDKGYVKLECIDCKERNERNETTRLRLLELLGGLKDRFSLNQIAILTRSNNEIEEVTSWLMSAGINVESERTLNIQENPYIVEIIAFLRFLDSPLDNLSFAHFVTGEIFSKASGLSQEEINAFLFSLRPKFSAEKDFYIYKAFRDKYPLVWDMFIADFFRNVGLYPMYELVASLFKRLKVFENFEATQGFFMRFLELIKEKEEEFSDLSTFLEQYEHFEPNELFVTAVASDAIRILTVHKSKGLEFPVVIIPFLGMTIHGTTGGGLGQQSFLLDFDEEHLRLLRIKKKYLKFSEKLEEIDRRERVRSLFSELNNTYVALTRASHELYAFIPDRIGSSRNLVRSLIPQEVFEQGAPATYSREEKLRQDTPLGPPVSDDQDWIDSLREEFIDDNRFARREERLRGEVMHYLLSFVGNLKVQNKEAIIQNALATAYGIYPQVKDWSAFEKSFRHIIEAKDLQPFFYSDAEILLEQDVVSQSGQTRRLDRTMVFKDEVWVVDYKSSKEGEEFQLLQLRDYLSILSTVYPGRTIKGFIIYLDDYSFREI